MGKDVKVNVTGVSMSVDTGDVTVFDNLADYLRSQILEISGGRDEAKLQVTWNLLTKRKMIIESVTPHELDVKNFEMWLNVLKDNPKMSGHKAILELIKTKDWQIFHQVNVKNNPNKKHSDPEQWCSNSIRRINDHSIKRPKSL